MPVLILQKRLESHGACSVRSGLWIAKCKHMLLAMLFVSSALVPSAIPLASTSTQAQMMTHHFESEGFVLYRFKGIQDRTRHSYKVVYEKICKAPCTFQLKQGLHTLMYDPIDHERVDPEQIETENGALFLGKDSLLLRDNSRIRVKLKPYSDDQSIAVGIFLGSTVGVTGMTIGALTLPLEYDGAKLGLGISAGLVGIGGLATSVWLFARNWDTKNSLHTEPMVPKKAKRIENQIRYERQMDKDGVFWGGLYGLVHYALTPAIAAAWEASNKQDARWNRVAKSAIPIAGPWLSFGFDNGGMATAATLMTMGQVGGLGYFIYSLIGEDRAVFEKKSKGPDLRISPIVGQINGAALCGSW